MTTDLELMIDIGNTHTVVGLFENSQLLFHWRLSSLAVRTEDEIWVVLKTFISEAGYDYKKVKGSSISSVVPNLTLIFNRMLTKYMQLNPLHITADLNLDMKILYEDPQAVGADRLCNAVAGKTKYGCPLIILDFGTATTFDCINPEGNYIGGVICPGIESAASVLHYKAAKLPKIELEFPGLIIGKNTEDSMKSGIMNGFVELINGLISKIETEMDSKPLVVATGGLASIIATQTNRINKIDENLNLEGLYYIYKRNSVTNHAK